MRLLYVVGPLAVLVVLGACAQQVDAKLVDGESVVVHDVVKGDEVLVQKGGKDLRVRILGVQAFAPVIDDPQVHALSAGSLRAVAELVKGKPVKLTFDTPVLDASGRYLAYLEQGGKDVGLSLLESGWAVVYTEFPFAREQGYLAAESVARAASKNMWGLKPAADLVAGLRRQWREARRAQGKALLADSLLD